MKPLYLCIRCEEKTTDVEPAFVNGLVIAKHLTLESPQNAAHYCEDGGIGMAYLVGWEPDPAAGGGE